MSTKKKTRVPLLLLLLLLSPLHRSLLMGRGVFLLRPADGKVLASVRYAAPATTLSQPRHYYDCHETCFCIPESWLAGPAHTAHSNQLEFLRTHHNLQHNRTTTFAHLDVHRCPRSWRCCSIDGWGRRCTSSTGRHLQLLHHCVIIISTITVALHTSRFFRRTIIAETHHHPQMAATPDAVASTTQGKQPTASRDAHRAAGV